jgi:hypothetical protein
VEVLGPSTHEVSKCELAAEGNEVNSSVDERADSLDQRERSKYIYGIPEE